MLANDGILAKNFDRILDDPVNDVKGEKRDDDFGNRREILKEACHLELSIRRRFVDSRERLRKEAPCTSNHPFHLGSTGLPEPDCLLLS